MISTTRLAFRWLFHFLIVLHHFEPATSFHMNLSALSSHSKSCIQSSNSYNHIPLQRQHMNLLLRHAAMSPMEKDEEYFATEVTQEKTECEKKQYFATCIPGLANVLSRELIEIGAKDVETSGSSGVYFSSDETSKVDMGLKALLWIRTAHRIMEMVATSTEDDYYLENPIKTKDDLYEFIQYSTPVQKILGDGKGGLLTLSVNVVSNGHVPKELCHSHYTALTIKNALVDKVRELRDDRPSVDLVDPDVPLLAVLKGNYDFDDSRTSVDVTLYRMLHSNGSLHRRGYRAATSSNESTGKVHKAAMKESLAAGLLLESGWNLLVNAAKEDGLPAVFIDPMAGSGTLSLEAALIASDFAPGLMRMKCYDQIQNNNSHETKRNPHKTPPVVRWKDADINQWDKLVSECESMADRGLNWMHQKNAKHPEKNNCVIMANELNSRAVDLALSNIENAGFSNFISMNEGDCQNWDLGGSHIDRTSSDGLAERAVVPGRTIIGTNPPWGLRLTEEVEASWYALNIFLRRECNSAEAWVLSGNKATTRVLRMKNTRKIVIKTADEDLRWIQYHIYKKKAEMEVVE